MRLLATFHAPEAPAGAKRLSRCAHREGRVTAAGPLPTLTGFPIKLVHLDLYLIRNGACGVKRNRCWHARSGSRMRLFSCG